MDETDVGKFEKLLQMTILQIETSNNTKEFCVNKSMYDEKLSKVL
jgi:hypothetical protein